MIKKIFTIVLVIGSVYAQENVNVLSYYASDNSLDGQPRIDMLNVLKFYPVFAVQDSIKNVDVTIYYGNNTYEANADKMSGGKYWQMLLPEFRLGDALQRVEVEMRFNLNYFHAEKIRNLDNEIWNLNVELNKIQPSFDEFLKIEKNLETKLNGYNFSVFRKAYNAMNIDLNNIDAKKENYLNKLEDFLKDNPATKDIPGKEEARKILRQNYINYFENVLNNKSDVKNNLEFIKDRESIVRNYQSQKETLYQKKNVIQQVKDSTNKLIFKDIVGELADTSFSGPAIRKSDLVISKDFKSATLLYRYYKNNLRYRKALDPAENLGIFRARYIPFPIVRRGGDEYSKVELISPGGSNAPVVFEIGLGFGDEIVSGDNTFKPAFSLSRLGIAIVITEKLFAADAEILGLALTYDFNSYASIGFGRNLAQGQSYPYMSFGINKKAFEHLLIGLAGLFK